MEFNNDQFQMQQAMWIALKNWRDYEKEYAERKEENEIFIQVKEKWIQHEKCIISKKLDEQ